MKPLPPGDHAGAHERRERYYELRRQGLSVTDAAARVGATDPSTVGRYERWFKATERGDLIVPGRAAARNAETGVSDEQCREVAGTGGM